MRRIIGTIAATLAIALMTPTLALANHREETKILKDPTADNTDTYGLSFGAPVAIISVAALLVPLLRGRDDHR